MKNELCIKCGVRKNLEEFPPRVDSKDGRRNLCRVCYRLQYRNWKKPNQERLNAANRRWYYANHERAKELGRKWGRANPKKIMDYRLRSQFGITYEDYCQMEQRQNSRCACCRQPETVISKQAGRTRRLHVDHDHKTGKVRGLLCTRCNMAIGFLKDDPKRARLVVIYLEQSRIAGIPVEIIQSVVHDSVVVDGRS